MSNRWQAIIWSNDGLVSWCMYASLGLNKWRLKNLRHFNVIKVMKTRTPAFWGYPPPPHDYPYHWVILDPKSKEDKVKVTNLTNFWISKRALHATHLLKLLDKMCKYAMDPMSIVEDTERTRFCPQTDRRTDGQMDRRTGWYQYTPLSTSLKRGYNKCFKAIQYMKVRKTAQTCLLKNYI